MKKSCQMQASILFFRWLEILGLVGNFQLKTFPQDGELWIEILSQGAGSWLQIFVPDQNPTLSSCPPSGITLLKHFKMAAFSVRTRQVSGDHDLVLQAMPLKFVCFIYCGKSDYLAVFLSFKGCIFNGWNTHRSLLFLLSRQNICYCFSIWKNG